MCGRLEWRTVYGGREKTVSTENPLFKPGDVRCMIPSIDDDPDKENEITDRLDRILDFLATYLP